MNKPLLQWKREIKERIIKCQKIESSLYPIETIEYKLLKEQLQMIDDIIEQKKKFEIWLENSIKEYEDIRKSDNFNERAKEQASCSILDFEAVLDRVRCG